MDNLRKRINVRLVNNNKDRIKYVSKPSFVSKKIFNKNFVAIYEIKPVLTLNKPVYVGFTILDLSKLLMYELHLKYIKRNYSAKLLFTDTDSLVYEIKTDDVYEDFYKNKNLFDFSDYPHNSKFFDSVNKKVIGKMKDEFKDAFLNSVDDDTVEEIKKAKGVNKNVVKNIRYKEYIDALFKKKMIRDKMKRIQSKLHRIETYDACKISLFCFDDKRYVSDDGINSLAYFHKDIKSQ